MKLLTFNCCGFPPLAPGTKSRMQSIARAVASIDPDIAAFQEVFFHRYTRALGDILGPRLPYCFFHSRLGRFPAGGLVLFSRFPIKAGSFSAYKARGPLLGKSIVGHLNKKGMLMARLKDPPLNIITTHLLPNFDGNHTDQGRYGRIQAAQLAQFLTQVNSLDKNIPLVIMGDFNFPPDCVFYERLIKEGALSDPLAHDPRPTGFGEWCKDGKVRAKPKRIDYILSRQQTVTSRSVITARLIFQDRLKKDHPKNYLSDHCGILAEIPL